MDPILGKHTPKQVVLDWCRLLLWFGSASSQISPEEAKSLRGFHYCLVDVFRPGRVFVDGDSKVSPTINYIKSVSVQCA